MDIGIVGIIVIIVAACILLKTGSVGKMIGFLLKWTFYPVLFAILFGLIIGLLLPPFLPVGILVGAIVGFIKACKDGSSKLK